MRVTSLWIPLLLLAGCDGGGSSPTAPNSGATTFTGSRSVAQVPVGGDTCLGRALAAKGADHVMLVLPEPGSSSFATLEIGGGGESCVVSYERSGGALTWSDYKCTQSCWWESFECDGRMWSFCRASEARPSFVGSITDDAVLGDQRLGFYATNGTISYDVEVVLAFELHR